MLVMAVVISVLSAADFEAYAEQAPTPIHFESMSPYP